jgi:hypothetical protein
VRPASVWEALLLPVVLCAILEAEPVLPALFCLALVLSQLMCYGQGEMLFAGEVRMCGGIHGLVLPRNTCAAHVLVVFLCSGPVSISVLSYTIRYILLMGVVSVGWKWYLWSGHSCCYTCAAQVLVISMRWCALLIGYRHQAPDSHVESVLSHWQAWGLFEMCGCGRTSISLV